MIVDACVTSIEVEVEVSMKFILSSLSCHVNPVLDLQFREILSIRNQDIISESRQVKVVWNVRQ